MTLLIQDKLKNIIKFGIIPRTQLSSMSFINPYKQIESPKSLPQKLSMLYIEQAYFHRIQIKQLSSLYKLNIRIKKPIVLSLHTLPVIKYIIDHSEIINLILQMENIYEIKLVVPGYGVFNQKYELEKVSGLFRILGQYCQHVSVSVKKISLEFPGWRTFSSHVIANIFQFIQKCGMLEEFYLNLNHTMHLVQNTSEFEEKQKEKQTENEDQIIFYGESLFQVQQFEILMKYIATVLPKNSLMRLELRFGAWYCVNSEVLEILTKYFGQIYQNYKSLKVCKLDLNGWGTGKYLIDSEQIKTEAVEHFFKIIEDLEIENSQLLEVDMRYWPSKYKITKFKQRFLYLSGGKKRDDQGPNTWTMTGTNFMFSQLKSKIMGRIKIQIKD